MTPTQTEATTVRDRRLLAAYDLLIIATAGLIFWFGPSSIPSSLALMVAAWAILSLALSPGGRRAGGALFLGAGMVLVLQNHPALPADARLWALACIGVTLAGLRLIPVSRAPFFPFVQLYLVLQLVYLVVAVLVAEPPTAYEDIFTVSVRTTGFKWMTLFTVVLVGSAFACSRVLWHRAEATIDPQVPLQRGKATSRAWTLIVVSLVTSTAIQALGLNASIGSLSTLVKLAGAGGAVLLTIFWFEGTLPILQRLALIGAAALLVLSGLGSGFLYQSALPGYLLLALLVGLRRYIPWLLLLVGASVLVVVNVSKSEFRTTRNAAALQGTTTEAQSSDAELGVSYLDRVAQDVSAGGQDVLATSAYRFANQTDQLGYYATWVPDRYPRYGYSTYLNLPRVIVPRFLDPSKPVFNSANEIGRRYELVAPNDRITTVNPSPAAEAYVAGGPRFLVVVAVAMGACLVGLGYVLRSRRISVVITGVLLAFQVMSAIESGVLSLFLTIPFGLVLYPLMGWMAIEERSGDTARSPR